MPKLLTDLGNSIRLGVIIAVVVAGGLWIYGSAAASRYDNWMKMQEEVYWGAMNKQFFGDPISGMTQDEFFDKYPRPFHPPIAQLFIWWLCVMGAYVVLVSVVQLSNRTR